MNIEKKHIQKTINADTNERIAIRYITVLAIRSKNNAYISYRIGNYLGGESLRTGKTIVRNTLRQFVTFTDIQAYLDRFGWHIQQSDIVPELTTL